MFWIGLRDALGSMDLVLPTWHSMRSDGRIIEHPTGPDTALYEIDDDDPLAVWVTTVEAQIAPKVPR